MKFSVLHFWIFGFLGFQTVLSFKFLDFLGFQFLKFSVFHFWIFGFSDLWIWSLQPLISVLSMPCVSMDLGRFLTVLIGFSCFSLFRLIFGDSGAFSSVFKRKRIKNHHFKLQTLTDHAVQPVSGSQSAIETRRRAC